MQNGSSVSLCIRLTVPSPWEWTLFSCYGVLVGSVGWSAGMCSSASYCMEMYDSGQLCLRRRLHICQAPGVCVWFVVWFRYSAAWVPLEPTHTGDERSSMTNCSVSILEDYLVCVCLPWVCSLMCKSKVMDFQGTLNEVNNQQQWQWHFTITCQSGLHTPVPDDVISCRLSPASLRPPKSKWNVFLQEP